MVGQLDDVTTFADIGCGAGELACTLAEKGYAGRGIDFSKPAIKVAKSLREKRGIDKKDLDFSLGGLEKLSKTKNDVLICCEVIEHIEDDKGFLKDLSKIDAKYAIFSVPARQKWFDHFDEKVGHYRRYEKEDLKKLLEKSGFEVVDFRSYGYPFINITRLIRKVMAGKVKDQDNIEKKTQESGINPIKLKSAITKLDIEPAMRPLYWISRPFNRFDLSEGYLVLCKRK